MMFQTDIDLSNFTLDVEVELIVTASVKLKCSVLTRTRALLIYHHFKRCVHETKYDPPLVAVACISLSAKYNEEPVDLDSIVLVLLSIIAEGDPQSTQNEKFKKMKKSAVMIELVVLRMLEFSLNHKLAHQYLAYFLNDMCEDLLCKDAWDVVTDLCMKITSDFYFTNRCLNYKAEEIASAVIQAALYMAGIQKDVFEVEKKVVDDDDGRHIWLKSLNECPVSRKLDIIEDIFRTCDISPLAKNSDFLLKRAY